ncbi:MAG TPA: hypothetical protein VMS30_00200 [Phycisphaerales bacterium]|nr:hypothetical protein [Phycisphaerales bacterium]
MPRRRVRRFLLGLILSLLLIGAGLAYTAWRLSWQQPAWYAPPDPRDEQVLKVADDTEYRLLEQTQKVRPVEEPWTLRLTAEQINAWLSARLPAWIEHDANLDWPEQIGTPQVLIDEGGLRVAVPVTTADRITRTVVGTLQPSIADDGRLSLKLRSMALGKIWVPGEPLTKLVNAVKDAAPEFLDAPSVQQAIDVLAGRSTLPPDYDLADGRRVRVKNVRLLRGAVEIQAVTLPDGEPDRASP